MGGSEYANILAALLQLIPKPRAISRPIQKMGAEHHQIYRHSVNLQVIPKISKGHKLPVFTLPVTAIYRRYYGLVLHRSLQAASPLMGDIFHDGYNFVRYC